MKKLLLCTVTLFLFVFSLFGEELHRLSHVHEQDCHVYLSDNCHEITHHHADEATYQFVENPCPLAVSLNFVRSLKEEVSQAFNISAKLIFVTQNVFQENVFSSNRLFASHRARGPPLV